MSRTQKCRWALVLLVLCSTVAVAQFAPQSPTIAVTGDAEIRVVPDEVMISVGVQTVSPSLKAAKTANDAAIARAINVTRRYRIPAEYVQTDFISIEPRYRTSSDDASLQVLGYTVRKSLVIRLREINKFDGLLADLVDAGVNVVQGIEFRTTQLRKYRDQARVMAVKAAREKADLLAREAGRATGKTLSISEGGGGWFSSYNQWWSRNYGYGAQNVMQNVGGGTAPGEGSVAPGEIKVTAHVSLTVALVG